MSSCAIPYCTNNKKNNVNNNSFFCLPKDNEQRAAWIKLINRVDKLPQTVVICDEHFALECFDFRAEFKRKHMPPGIFRFHLLNC